MTLLSAWALAGLLLTVPLVLLHLRRRQPPSREVSSLVPWRELATDAPSPSWHLGRPVLPLLLLLQLLALVLLVLSLAQAREQPRDAPAGTDLRRRRLAVDAAPRTRGRTHGSRTAGVERPRCARCPADTHVQIVLAGPTASLLYSGPAHAASSAHREAARGRRQRRPVQRGCALRAGCAGRPGNGSCCWGPRRTRSPRVRAQPGDIQGATDRPGLRLPGA